MPHNNSNNSENKQVSFDDYIDNYKSEVQSSIGFIGQEVDFFLDIKAEMLVRLAEKNFGKTENIKALDIGSGIGLVDKLIKSRIKNLHGVDIEDGVVKQAIINNPEVHYQKYDGENLPFNANTFDITFAINVMHHVPPALWENFSKEMHRVLKPGGICVVFEHNPFNPLTRKVVKDCEFDRDADGRVRARLREEALPRRHGRGSGRDDQRQCRQDAAVSSSSSVLFSGFLLHGPVNHYSPHLPIFSILRIRKMQTQASGLNPMNAWISRASEEGAGILATRSRSPITGIATGRAPH